MFPSFLITFRETLEATLIIGIILSCFTTTQVHFKKYVGYGVLGGVVSSVFLAELLRFFFGGLTGKTEQTFEGSLMFVTAIFLSWMILWVHRQKNVIGATKKKLTEHIGNNFKWGITVLAFTSILREGVETVLYLHATSLSSGGNQILGVLLGIGAALLSGYLIFRWTLHHRISMVFRITSFFLLLFAAGMVMHGVHEFQEAGLLPFFPIDPLINLSKVLNHETGFGSFLHALFGYTSTPSVLELFSYAVYLYAIFWLEKFTDRLITSQAK